MKGVFLSLLLSAAIAQGALVARDGSAPDFAAVNAAPQPAVSGPSPGDVQQTVVAGDEQASASGAAAASATDVSKRHCWGWWCQPSQKPSPDCTTSAKKPTTSPAKITTTKPTTTKWTTTSKPTTVMTTTKSTSSWQQPSTCTNTPYSPYYPALSHTATATASSDSTGTETVSSSTACPTQPEDGTYCGFINPNDDCAPQPDGYGPVPTPDTPDAFLAYAPFHQAAQSATTPSGYTQVFKDLNASVSAPNYLGLKTLQSYSPEQCAHECECVETCSSFNIYIERDPSLNPTSACSNPASMTSYKCTLWGGPINSTDAVNTGQTRGGFTVVITGSNGYIATPAKAPPAPQPGWGHGHHCPGGGIIDGHHHMGGHFFPGPFDPRICAAFAEAQTKKNYDACKPGGKYQACNLWNAFALIRDGKFLGMYCSLFTDHPADPRAEQGGYLGGNAGGHHWDISWSWTQARDDSNWDHGVKEQ